MLVGITGARVRRGEHCYKVIYKEQVIFESKTKEIAVSIALSRKECENLLTKVLNSV
jgi:hypothetical protein